jgi:hypothetical protein
MIHNQFEHLFGEIHTRSIGDTFNAERHGLSSGWNHEFSMIPLRIIRNIWFRALSSGSLKCSSPEVRRLPSGPLGGRSHDPASLV